MAKEWRVYAKAKPGQSPSIIITFPSWDEPGAREWFKDHQADKPGHFYEGMTLQLVEFETKEERIERERDRYRDALIRIENLNIEAHREAVNIACMALHLD